MAWTESDSRLVRDSVKTVKTVENTPMVEIEGQVERIAYRAENGYTVATIRPVDTFRKLTIVGNISYINIGECLRLKGQWQDHPRYGRQLEVISCEYTFPVSTVGIEKYLSSGLIKGIGPVMSKRIVSRFGTDTLHIIDTDIERLKEVEGIGDARVEVISKAWKDQKEIREVMVYLHSCGISPAYATKIYNTYGNDSIAVIKENPYRLIYDIPGIGFITADRIAKATGIPDDSQVRIEAGILYVLSQATESGHACLPFEVLVDKCRNLLGTGISNSTNIPDLIAGNEKVVTEQHNNTLMVYLAGLYKSETGIVSRLKDIIEQPGRQFHDRDRIIENVQKRLGITLSGDQLQAVKDSMDRKVLVITGGPGTGKTTVINAIAGVYESAGLRVSLCAPTGKAAKRITEATGYEAKTIHRLLEYNPLEGRFGRNYHNPIDADLVIVDEASMIDTVLMYHFLKAVPDSSTLILVGDIDQLPSVGPGNVLRDIIDSGAVPVVRLNCIFRQSGNSMIILNAHRINEGEMPFLNPLEGQLQDFHFFEVDDPDEVLQQIVRLCKHDIPSAYGYDPINDIQVLTPMYKGVIGAINLNAELQRHLNPSGNELVRDNRILRVGDKVMHIKNNYEKDIFNGDTGRISDIDHELQKVVVNYDEKSVEYDYSELDELILAYAVTVHKSQGSEYPVVVMPVMPQHYVLLQRNLVYTGITRAKRMVILVGTKKAVAMAVRNNNPQKRYTLLRDRLSSQGDGLFL